ncbi:MAG: class I SAM-dependent methyltransferase [Thermotogota bacterium]|nr:class I SAM-dependent methyltransferase [Thermotogota bacterium]
MDNSTIHYYNLAATSLIGRYESAEMAETHDSLLRHIPRGTRVLEIGCGSGRDAAFLFSEGYDVTAIDPSSKMIEATLRQHPELGGRVHCSGLPLPQGHSLLSRVFDAAIAIAVVMHMSDADLIESAVQVRNVLSLKGVFIVSSSFGRKEVNEARDSNGRLYVERSCEEIQQMLARCDFELIELLESEDGLHRDLKWLTIIMKCSHSTGARRRQ